MNRLGKKNALITRRTSGIGLETAREFLNEGARIAITAKDQVSLEAARKELGNDRVLLIASDAGNAQGQKQVAEYDSQRI
jgi:NADP-dependent 3-hydroxy acid dehydrogenase YdfG